MVESVDEVFFSGLLPPQRCLRWVLFDVRTKSVANT